MSFINLSMPAPGMSDGFFESLYSGAKDYASNIVDTALGNAKQKVVQDAKDTINETLGIEKNPQVTPTATTTQVVSATSGQPVVSTNSVQTDIEAAAEAAKKSAGAILQTQTEAWKSYFAGITAANCKAELDKLTPEKKAQAEAAAKALGITLPCSSVAKKAENFLSKNKEIIAAGAIGAGSFYLSKSPIGAAIAGVATYFISKKLMA